MFVRADNRTFQNELSQEEAQQPQQQQQDESQYQGAISGVTSEALAQLPGAAPGKRKFDTASSVATNRSIRSNLANVDLDFGDEPILLSDQDQPSVVHAEFPGEVNRPGRQNDLIDIESDAYMGGTAESAAKVGQPSSQDSSALKEPEMQERSGGVSFFARPSGASPQKPMDPMDLDMEQNGRAP